VPREEGTAHHLMMRIRIAAAALALSDCALTFTRGPSSDPQTAYPDCSTSSLAPALDVGGTIVWLLGIASVQSLSGLPGGDEPGAVERQRTSMGIMAGLATLHVVSLVVGSGRISRCKKAREAWTARNGPPLA
jgi:hypothetical protein